jgi:hypothetical protein
MLVIMEWAETGIVSASVAQFDPGLGYEVDNVNLGFDFVYCGHRVTEL